MYIGEENRSADSLEFVKALDLLNYVQLDQVQCSTLYREQCTVCSVNSTKCSAVQCYCSVVYGKSELYAMYKGNGFGSFDFYFYIFMILLFYFYYLPHMYLSAIYF